MKKILLIATLVSLTFSLSACNKRDEDPQAVIDKAWTKWMKSRYDVLEGQINFDFDTKAKVEKNALDLSGAGIFLFDLQNVSDVKGGLQMDLSGDGSYGGKSGKGSLSAELRTFGAKNFFQIKGVKLKTENPQLGFFVDLLTPLYQGKWFEIPSPINTLALIQRNDVQKGLENAKAYNFFDAKEELGWGKYELKLNTERFKKYVSDANSSAGTPIDEQQLLMLEKFIQTLDYEIIAKISHEDDVESLFFTAQAENDKKNERFSFTLDASFEGKRRELDLSFELSGKTNAGVELSFQFEQDKKAVHIRIPEQFELFDLKKILSGLSPL